MTDPGRGVLVFAAPLSGAPGPQRALLDDGERERADRFHFERDRRRFTLAHAALRHVLARAVGEAPERLRFEVNGFGKPSLTGHAGLHFNLSHSGELALIALTRTGAVGVDVEQVRELEDLLRLARHNFSPAELAALETLAPAEHAGAFFRCWTRKEAYIKALGQGLSHPLDAFDVSLGLDEPARFLGFRDGTLPDAWSLHDLRPRDGYAAALAVGGSPQVTLLPFVAEGP